jgi:membrane carboxypeptidase/penicillin-binding protein
LIAILENPSARGQKYLTYDQDGINPLPENLIKATVSSIEPNFWNNPGLSWASMQNESRPTIAQKITRQFIYQDGSSTSNQSFQEWLLAAQLINSYGHEQILEWYLNSEYFGNLAYGVDAAARVYFEKSASDLTLAEAAAIVAAGQTPSINPIDAPIGTNQAKDRILTEMFDQGLITFEQLESGLNQEIKVRSVEGYPENLAPAFTNLVIEQISRFIPQERIFRGGLEIITSLDSMVMEMVITQPFNFMVTDLVRGTFLKITTSTIIAEEFLIKMKLTAVSIVKTSLR